MTALSKKIAKDYSKPEIQLVTSADHVPDFKPG